MRISRIVSMNPVEPQPLSARVPSGMQIKIDFQYLDFTGKALTDDVAAQLQLVSRSENRLMTYAVPATDIVNGKARATIPQGDLIDMNGYQLKLVGTYKQEPTLFAVGNLSLTQAAGFDAMPEDVIDNVPISMTYNFDAAIYIRLWQDANKGTPYDLTSTTITAFVYPTSVLASVLAAFTVTPTVVPGEVILSLPVAVVNTLPSGCWWNLKASTAAGTTTLAEGIVTIMGIRPT
jgi:hypothetical protein